MHDRRGADPGEPRRPNPRLTAMTRFGLPALLLAVSVSLAGCGSDGGDDDVATDPGGSGRPSDAPQAPTTVPAADGDVRSRNLVTVMDKDAGDDLVELCLGPVAESYPPQCGGPAITNWDWKSVDMFEQQGGVRWGTFAVTGTWDGTAFTLTDAIPAALYDPMPEEPPVYPEPSVDLSDTELQEIADEVMDLPGIQGAYADPETGHVLTDITYDDGTYQDYADEAYGAGVVVVTSALVDVDGLGVLVLRLQRQADRVDAVAVAGRGAVAVGEDVAEVRAAVGAADLGALHAHRRCPRGTRSCR